MPRAYRITSGEDNPGAYRYLISGNPSYVVPPVRCSACGDNRSRGFHFPSLEVENLDADITRYLFKSNHILEGLDRRDHLTVEEFKSLESKLLSICGPERPLSPFTGLGPLKGTAEGKFGDFAWVRFDNLLLARQSVFQAMQDAGFALTGVRSQLRYRRQRHDRLIELEALPTARAHQSERRDPCQICGIAKKSRGPVKLDAAAFDESMPLQRIFDCPEVIVVNEPMARFIRDRNLLDVQLTPLAFL